LGDRLRALAVEHLELLAGRDQCRLALLQLCVAGAHGRIGLLGTLDRAGAGLHQIVITGAFLLGEFLVGLSRLDLGRLLRDDRLLQLDLGIEVVHGGLRSRDIGMGLIQRGAEISVVDARQKLAGLDRLVVRHRDFGDVAGDLRRDDGGIGLHIGIVGRLEIAAGRDVAVAEVSGNRDAGCQRQHEARALDPPPGQAQAGFFLLFSDIGQARHGNLRTPRTPAQDGSWRRSGANMRCPSSTDNLPKNGYIIHAERIIGAAPMDRLTSLTAFVQVVDAGGFSAAGRKLNMSTTMVSNHIQALEERLGVRLLNRTTRKVSVTEIGRAYYDRATQILADLEQADDLASAQQSAPRGTLRVHTATHMVPLIAPVVAEFLASYPEVKVDLRLGEANVDLIEEGFDVALRMTPPPDSSLIVRKLATWRHVLCCSHGYLDQHG